MLIVPIGPSVTISEVEIGLPALAQLYSQAIGEPVDVLPVVERRAVAVFARNEPWDRVIAMAGESAGFRLARKGDRLRFESTRPIDQASLETNLGGRILALLSPPDDVAGTSERQRAARTELLALQRKAKTPEQYRRVHELRAAVFAGTVVNSAEALALGRYLQRGGGLTLGESVVFNGSNLLNNDEFALFTEGTTAAGASVATLRIAARVTLRSVELASTVRTPEGGIVRRSERFELQALQDPATSQALATHRFDPERRPVPRFGSDWSIGDYLRWVHESEATPCAAPALRIALESPDDRGFGSLSDHGYRLVERDGTLVATSEWGEGFWPRDFRDLDTMKAPQIRDYAKFATLLKPAARAATLDSLTFLGTHPMQPLRDGGDFLRLFASLPYEMGSLLLDGHEVLGSSLTIGARRALLTGMAEAAGPAAALAPVSSETPLAIGMRGRSNKVRTLFLDSGLSFDVARDVARSDLRIEFGGRPQRPVEQQDGVVDKYEASFGEANARFHRSLTFVRREGAKTPFAPASDALR